MSIYEKKKKSLSSKRELDNELKKTEGDNVEGLNQVLGKKDLNVSISKKKKECKKSMKIYPDTDSFLRDFYSFKVLNDPDNPDNPVDEKDRRKYKHLTYSEAVVRIFKDIENNKIDETKQMHYSIEEGKKKDDKK